MAVVLNSTDPEAECGPRGTLGTEDKWKNSRGGVGALCRGVEMDADLGVQHPEFYS